MSKFVQNEAGKCNFSSALFWKESMAELLYKFLVLVFGKFGQFENLLVLSDIMPPLEMSHTRRCLHNKFFQIYSWLHLKIAIMDSTDLPIFVETEDQWFWAFEWNYQYDT